MKPKTVFQVELAFGGDIPSLLPKRDAIPSDFKESYNYWNKVASTWFYDGLDFSAFKPKDGIDKAQAIGHLKAIMVSFEPKHEHKIAGVAYLMSLWFEQP